MADDALGRKDVKKKVKAPNPGKKTPSFHSYLESYRYPPPQIPNFAHGAAEEAKVKLDWVKLSRFFMQLSTKVYCHQFRKIKILNDLVYVVYIGVFCSIQGYF